MPSHTTFHAVFCFDAHNVLPFLVAYASILRHVGRPTTVHCFTRGVPPIEHLSHARAPLHQCDISGVSVDPFIDGYLSGNRTTRSTFDRLLLPRLLPLDITACLYVDTDIVACGDISTLADLPGASAVGMSYRESTGAWHSMRAAALAMDGARLVASMGAADWVHGNVGVIAMNLTVLRATAFCDSCCRVAADYCVNDQLAVNYCARGRFGRLPASFNVYANKECVADAPDVRILHFAGARKPWRDRPQCAVCRACWQRYYDYTRELWDTRAIEELLRPDGYAPTPTPPASSSQLDILQ